MKYLINGKVFSKKNITGLTRYTIEILKVVDNYIENIDIQLIVPKIAYNIPKFKNIKVLRVGEKLPLVLWEQLTVYKYALKEKRKLINITNTAPVLKPDILFIHDINITKNTKYFSKAKVMYYKILFWLNIKRAKKLITISEFMKDEISRKYKIEKSKIIIISNAWQHINVYKYKNIKKENTFAKEYFFILGIIDKHKNLEWVFEAAKNNPKYDFYISGVIANQMIFKNKKFMISENIKYLGYLSDEEMVKTMINSKAFICPSLYEGFGLAPIEALALGTKIIISDILVFKEIYKNSAYYIDPYNPNVDLDKILKQGVEPKENILKNYSWEKSGKKFIKEVLD